MAAKYTRPATRTKNIAWFADENLYDSYLRQVDALDAKAYRSLHTLRNQLNEADTACKCGDLLVEKLGEVPWQNLAVLDEPAYKQTIAQLKKHNDRVKQEQKEQKAAGCSLGSAPGGSQGQCEAPSTDPSASASAPSAAVEVKRSASSSSGLSEVQQVLQSLAASSAESQGEESKNETKVQRLAAQAATELIEASATSSTSGTRAKTKAKTNKKNQPPALAPVEEQDEEDLLSDAEQAEADAENPDSAQAMQEEGVSGSSSEDDSDSEQPAQSSSVKATKPRKEQKQQVVNDATQAENPFDVEFPHALVRIRSLKRDVASIQKAIAKLKGKSFSTITAKRIQELDDALRDMNHTLTQADPFVQGALAARLSDDQKNLLRDGLAPSLKQWESDEEYAAKRASVLNSLLQKVAGLLPMDFITVAAVEGAYERKVDKTEAQRLSTLVCDLLTFFILEHRDEADKNLDTVMKSYTRLLTEKQNAFIEELYKPCAGGVCQNRHKWNAMRSAGLIPPLPLAAADPSSASSSSSSSSSADAETAVAKRARRPAPESASRTVPAPQTGHRAGKARAAAQRVLEHKQLDEPEWNEEEYQAFAGPWISGFILSDSSSSSSSSSSSAVAVPARATPAQNATTVATAPTVLAAATQSPVEEGQPSGQNQLTASLARTRAKSGKEAAAEEVSSEQKEFKAPATAAGVTSEDVEDTKDLEPVNTEVLEREIKRVETKLKAHGANVAAYESKGVPESEYKDIAQQWLNMCNASLPDSHGSAITFTSAAELETVAKCGYTFDKNPTEYTKIWKKSQECKGEGQNSLGYYKETPRQKKSTPIRKINVRTYVLTEAKTPQKQLGVIIATTVPQKQFARFVLKKGDDTLTVDSEPGKESVDFKIVCVQSETDRTKKKPFAALLLTYAYLHEYKRKVESGFKGVYLDVARAEKPAAQPYYYAYDPAFHFYTKMQFLQGFPSEFVAPRRIIPDKTKPKEFYENRDFNKNKWEFVFTDNKERDKTEFLQDANEFMTMFLQAAKSKQELVQYVDTYVNAR